MKTKYAVLIGLIVASSLGGAGYVIHEALLNKSDFG